jgi:hypothetical protein
MLRINAALVLTASLLLAGTAQGATRGATVPQFNISSACDALARIPEARMVDTTQPDSTKHCVEAESEARDQLIKQWSQFNAADRNMCVGVSSAGSVDPVYTELMTCLEMARDSRQLTDRTAQAAPANSPNGQQSAQNQR